MTDNPYYGPGPIIIGPANDGTPRVMVRYHDQPGIHFLTHAEICAVPIRAQWFTGTRTTGLISSWATHAKAQSYALEHTTLLGRITPINIDALSGLIATHHLENNDHIAILTDPHGTPLRAQP